MRRLRIVAIELGMCRSGRIGGASGSVTVGNGRSRERRGEMWSRGGDGASFGDQKAVGGNTEGGMVVEAAPPAPFIITKPEFLLQLLIIALDPPSQLCDINQTFEGDIEAPPNWWTPLLSSGGSGKVSNGPGTASFYG